MTKKQQQKRTWEEWIKLRTKQQRYRTKKGVTGPIQTVGTGIGTLLGSGIGGPIGGAIGGAAGSIAGYGVGWIAGTGDYKTNFAQVKNSVTPAFGPNNGITVCKREYMGDIFSSTTAGGFQLNKHVINPANSATFPWLSSIAGHYEEYEFVGLCFEFKSSSGDSVNSTNTALGTVTLATQYDPEKPDFISKMSMEDHYFSTSSKPSDSILHAVECKKSRSPTGGLLYVGDQTNDADKRWRDFGNFFISSSGMQGTNVNIGELWVTYKIKLIKPRLPNTITIGAKIASAAYNRTGVSAVAPLGTTTSTAIGPLGLDVGTSTIGFWAKPRQKYFLQLFYYGATTLSPVPLPSAGTNLTATAFFDDRISSKLSTGVATSTEQVFTGYYVADSTQDDEYVVLTLGNFTTLTGTPECSIVLAQLDWSTK